MKTIIPTGGEWEIRGNKIFIKGTYNSIATIHIQKSWNAKFKPIKDYKAIANAKVLASAKANYKALQKIQKEINNVLHRVAINNETLDLKQWIGAFGDVAEKAIKNTNNIKK